MTSTADAIGKLEAGFSKLFKGSHRFQCVFESLATVEYHGVALIVMDDRNRIQDSEKQLEYLRKLESMGMKFKLVKESSLRGDYSLRNICFDLFQLLGGLPWTLADAYPDVVAFDAGHSKELSRSRWVGVYMGQQLAPVTATLVDTPLREDMTPEAIGALWPGDLTAKVYRDGRFLKERDQLVAAAVQEQRTLLGVTKSPNCVLYRTRSDGDIGPAVFGDALENGYGEMYVQTSDPRPDDYSGPMKVSCAHTESSLRDEVGHLLALCAAPAMTVSNPPRLPGPIYWADKASKLDANSWASVIGRGLGVSEVVPQLRRKSQ